MRLLAVEEIQQIQSHLAVLTDLYEERSLSFADESKQWIIKLEDAFRNNKLPQVADLSSYRTLMISYERGFLPNQAVSGRYNSKRKQLAAAIVTILTSVNSLVSETLKPFMAQLGEVERIMSQVLSVASAKGLLAGSPTGTHTQNMIHYWSRISEDNDLMPLCIHMSGLIHPQDILIVLDRTITGLGYKG
ncbi:MAG TPA: hypothetical protein DDY25_01865 [Peptococcaceae bacterium]|nr:hypothetical protein [Peptococcaceae bacterium]